LPLKAQTGEKNVLKKKKITLMLIPHGISRPFRTTISPVLLGIFVFFWIISLSWAIYIIYHRVDYAQALKANKTLTEKTDFLAQTISQSRDYIEKVKAMETELRGMLQLKSKKDIIESSAGIGGPSIADHNIVKQLLEHDSSYMSREEIEGNIRELKKDSWQRITGFSEIKNYIDAQASLLLSTPCIWPCYGNITSSFGWRTHPLSRNLEFHEGLDIANEQGSHIRATADGRVVFADWQGGYGRLLIIDHGNGFSTHYCHCSKLLAKVGESVRRGQIIATMGETGRTTASHLHYEVWHNNKPVNPAGYLTKN